MNQQKIQVDITLKLIDSEDPPNQIRAGIIDFARRIERDAIHGTFEATPSGYFDALPGIHCHAAARQEFEDFARRAARLDDSELGDESIRRGEVQVKFCLDPEPFSDVRFGLQHLIGILAGDVLQRSSPVVAGAKVTRIDFGPLEKKFRSYYREGEPCTSHSIDRVLEGITRPDRPLLAWSIKPRVGLHCLPSFSLDAMAQLVAGVTGAGVDFVEMDTRDLRPGNEAGLLHIFQTLSQAAMDGASTWYCKKVGRFVANLSYPARMAVPLAEQLARFHGGEFWVAKVDGGLDGLSTIQAIRTHLAEKDLRQPIITCYPLLNYAGLRQGLGRDGFIDALALSGADILYPGGGPEVGNAGIDPQSAYHAIQRYGRLQARGWPLPSVAGGLHPGHFHAIAELLGPRLAYFVGGGIALHRSGPIAGAAYARACLDAAAVLAQQSEPDWDNPPEILQRCAAEFGATPTQQKDNFQYVNPKAIFENQGYVRWHDRRGATVRG